MKKVLKITGWVLLILVGTPLITALLISKDFKFEATVQINEPVDSVWLHTNSLKALEKWNPWAKMDPDMKSSYNGEDGKIGASHTWDSEHPDVGAGTQTIYKIEAPKLFHTKLQFTKPWESEAEGYIKLTKNGSGTEVVWGFSAVMPYPTNLMKLIPNKKGEKAFIDGLAALKKLCEQ